ncbi:MAG: hypothetical protein JO053_04040, partial [Acidobacteria bacterium]|nr:hypothetical protein [Acidobacteriota bacterium]
MDDRASIATNTPKGRALSALLVLAALIFVWFGVRWQIGHMLATLVRPDANGAYSLSQLAANWASADPAAWALWANTLDDPAADERLDALPVFQRSAQLGPYDLKWRVSLAKALEQDGQPESAEGEYRKAVDLAPNFSETHWELGNFLLRLGREDEAVSELRFAARGQLYYREQFFSILWDRSGRDESKLADVCGDDPELKSYLAFFFASRGKSAAARHAWLSLSEDERRAYSSTGGGIAQALLTQRHYSDSLAIARTLGNTSEVGSVTNGSF